jgi:hypothetical protein
VVATAMIAPRSAVTEVRIVLASLVTALATLAIARLYAPVTRYPRRAYWIMATLMAAGILASAFLARDPEHWRRDVGSTAWMYPWFFIVLDVVKPSARSACAPGSPWAGRLLIITGVLFALVLQLPGIIG